MKRLLCLVFAVIFLLPGCASAETKEGPCALKESSAFDDDVFTVVVGDRIKGTCKFYIDDFFKKRIVNANITIENTTDIPLFCHYYVAFFDKENNLVGCAAQGTFGDDGLEPESETQLGSCLIPLPKGMHEKITSYRVVFYESEIPIGK